MKGLTKRLPIQLSFIFIFIFLTSVVELTVNTVNQAVDGCSLDASTLQPQAGKETASL